MAPPQLLFVQCQTPDKAKIRVPKGSKSKARAHVIKQMHRRHRLERMQAFHDERNHVSDSHQRVEKAVGEIVKSEVDEEEEQKPAAAEEDGRQVCHLLASKSIQTILSENRADPFSSLGELPDYMQRVLDHAVNYTWPATVPIEGKAIANPINNAWMRCSMDNPVVLHAFLWAAALHLAALSNGREPVKSAPLIRLAEKTRTIEMINQQLRELKGPPPDALIMAVCTMAVHGEIDPNHYQQCHPISPLAEGNYLHVYGQILAAEEHIQGIMLMIAQKGGLENVQTYGMRYTLQLAGIFFATKYQTRPIFRLDQDWASLYVEDKSRMDSEAVKLESKLGSGFHCLDSSASKEMLLEVLKPIIETTVALDQHARKADGAPAMSAIVHERNAAQHALLSLNFDSATEDLEQARLAEVCRVATLIYSDLVIFPLPPQQRAKERLAAKLQEEIEANFELLTSDNHLRLFTWIAVLGTIAASFTPRQPIFSRLLGLQIGRLGIQGWSPLQDLCQEFLWWQPVCEEPLIRVTEQAMHLSSVHNNPT